MDKQKGVLTFVHCRGHDDILFSFVCILDVLRITTWQGSPRLLKPFGDLRTSPIPQNVHVATPGKGYYYAELAVKRLVPQLNIVCSTTYGL